MRVHYGRASKPSGQALARALAERGYGGQHINFGYGASRSALNSPQAIANATNKRRALQLMAEAGVPIPRPLAGDQYCNMRSDEFPIVGRPDKHCQGRGFWYCRTQADIHKALRGTRRKAAATHFMEFIEADHEFRVHIINGESIKISEKFGSEALTRNHAHGVRFGYPHDFNHKKTVRRVAKEAVEALGLDFGAVDVLWADGKPYVLEVNTAPCLTDNWSDTLERYAEAFVRSYA